MSISVLVVDDSDEKWTDVTDLLLSIDGIKKDLIARAKCVAQAKSLMMEKAFDLVILDLMLPIREGGELSRSGGRDIVETIFCSSRYSPPSLLIGLTAFEDCVSESRHAFDERLLSLVWYDSFGNWRKAVASRIEHFLLCESRPRSPKVDVAVIATLKNVELPAARNLLNAQTQYHAPGDASLYFLGGLNTDKGVARVVIASAPEMGMVAASVLSCKMISAFSPRYICLVGIAAGIEGRSNIGDVILFDPCWNYDDGKYVGGDESQVRFEADPRQLRVDSTIRSNIEQIADEAFLFSVRNEFAGSRPSHVSRLLVGPAASGGAVVASSSVIKEKITPQARKLVGFDMEAYGLMYAAVHAPEPRPRAFVLKCVCDLADFAKTDDYQGFAAFLSARVLKEWIVRFI